jgi:ferredoxin-NADP reductase
VLGSTELIYEPGEYLEFFVPLASGLTAKRAYSIANAVRHLGPRRVEIAVTRVPGGAASASLHQLPVGTELDAEGPRGSLRRLPEERHEAALFVAAGSGLAPLRAMLQDELSRSRGPRVALLFGCRTQADMLWAEELKDWTRQSDRFRLEVTLSRPGSEWRGRTGHVQRHVPELAAGLAPTRAYVCGLSPMVNAVTAALRREGLTGLGKIRTEAYDA